MTQSTKPPANKPAPLGRGLSALFGDADASYTPQKITVTRLNPQEATPKPTGAPHRMPLAWLQPGAFQPRRMFGEDGLKGLAESIRERGILEPLLVRPMKGLKDSFEIIAGERRWRAAQLAGLHEVPVLVRELSDREALEFGLIENIQRQDLSPLEEAEGYQRLLGEFSHSQDALAKIVGKSRPHITNMLRLLTLPAAVKQMIDEGKLTMGHARAIITADNPVYLANEIITRGLNVRQAEALAKERSENPQNFLKGKTAGKSADTIQLERDLERAIGLRVQLKKRGHGGKAIVYYKNLDQLDEIIKRLKG